MAEQSGPNYRRRQLGRTLRRLREGIGMSQEQMGRPLRFSKSKMSRVEQGYIPGYNDFLALPNLAVQVIPQDVGSHDGLYSNFIVVSFPEPAEVDLAYVEYGFGSMQIEKEQEVRAVTLLFEHLAEVALDEQDSLALISGM